MRRYAYSNRYPVLYLGFETGHWTDGLYAHLRVMLTQHANLGMGGTLTYALQGGAVFGTVPDAFLWQASANQGYAYDPYRFTFLHGRQLLADHTLQSHSRYPVAPSARTGRSQNSLWQLFLCRDRRRYRQYSPGMRSLFYLVAFTGNSLGNAFSHPFGLVVV